MIKSINLRCTDSVLADDFFADTLTTVIKEGDNLDLDILQNERKRIETRLKNKGYYKFNKEFIFFQADSSAKTKEVDLVLNIHKPQSKAPDNTIVESNHKKYLINRVYVFTNFDQKEALSQGSDYYTDLDTVFVDGIYYISKGEDKLNKRVIFQSNFVQE